MIITLKRGNRLPLAPGKSDPDVLSQYFKELSAGYYEVVKDVIVDADKIQKERGWAIRKGAASLDEIISTKKKPAVKKQKRKGKKLKKYKNGEQRILWVSRHNMQMSAYLALVDDIFKDSDVHIFPCQPRVNEAVQIVNLADQYECTTICAILPDEIFHELVSQCSDRIRILRPILTAHDTGRSYCPKGTLTVKQQKEYHFHGWRDMETGQILGKSLAGK